MNGPLEAKTTVSNSAKYYLFIGDLKKYTASGVTFSFKQFTPLYRRGLELV